MSTRGTLFVEDAYDDQRSIFCYISSDAGSIAERALMGACYWANDHKRTPSAEQFFQHLHDHEEYGRLFVKSSGNIHPFDDAQPEIGMMGGGRGSPFNEYEYRVRFVKTDHRGTGHRAILENVK